MAGEQINPTNLIWSIAELLRGNYGQADYGKVILPFTLLRRLDCVLAPTKKAVLEERNARKDMEDSGVDIGPFLMQKSGLSFYNSSRFDMPALLGEPLLKFRRGALVHFAASTLLVRMTTRLDGVRTRFLPFDMGRDEGAGNPDDPVRGYRTSYFWHDILARDSFLDILGNFVHLTERREKDPMRGLMRWVRLHQHNISQKCQLVVEHFREAVAHKLQGKAKAMVVCSSRKEAVRWKLAMDKYLKSMGYPMHALVAFSGEVEDPESGTGPFHERSEGLNPGLRGRDLREVFAEDDYKVMIVANKYQTGFDQPLLCAMYVDKRLDGVQAVQTLSRLNRTYPGKDSVFVLDFVNEPELILAAFRPYFRRAELSGVTNPNIVHDLLSKIMEAGILTEDDVSRCSGLFYQKNVSQSAILKALAGPLSRFDSRWRRALEAATSPDESEAREGKALQDGLLLFKSDCVKFLRLYDFLSQIIDYKDTDLERSAVVIRLLSPLLVAEKSRVSVDLSGVEMTHYALKDGGKRTLRLDGKSESGDDRLQPIGDVGTGGVRDAEAIRLGEIIAKVNDLFEGENLTDADKVNYIKHLHDRLLEDPVLATQAKANTMEQFSDSPDFKKAVTAAILGAYDSHKAMSEKALRSEEVQSRLGAMLVDMVWQSFAAGREGGRPAA